MESTPNLILPYIAAAQAQKHVTHNEAIRALDAILHLSVLDRDLAVAPASPVDGERYIVATGGSGSWAGADGQIAAWQDGAWTFYAPREGWLVWISDEDQLYAWDGADWTVAGGASINPTPLVGINTTADTTNRLSINAPASLFNHDGAGHQQKINKAAPADTASQLYQTGFSGRAEIGLTGDDDFHFKVSADGSTWKEAITIDGATGAVTFPFTSLGGSASQPNLLINGDFQINQRSFAGGALAAGAYGFDRWKAAAGGASLSLAGYVATLQSGELKQIIEPDLWGFSSFASKTITVSAEAPSSDLTVTIGSQSGTISAGSGRQATSLTLGGGDTGTLPCSVKNASAGSVSFGRLKVELASVATQWQPRSVTVEEALANCYFERLNYTTSATIALAWAQTTTFGRAVLSYTAKRTTPTVTFSDTNGFKFFGFADSVNFDLMTAASPSLKTTGINFVMPPANPFVADTAKMLAVKATGSQYIDIDAEL